MLEEAIKVSAQSDKEKRGNKNQKKKGIEKVKKKGQVKK